MVEKSNNEKGINHWVIFEGLHFTIILTLRKDGVEVKLVEGRVYPKCHEI